MGTWRLKAARARQAHMTSELDSADSDAAALRESLENARKEAEEAARSNTALDQTNRDLVAAQAALSDETSGLSQELQKLRETVRTLRGEKDGLCTENQKLGRDTAHGGLTGDNMATPRVVHSEETEESRAEEGQMK